MTKAQAEKAAANGSPFPGRRGKTLNYADINPKAAGWVLVDASIHWVKEIGPNTSVVSGLQGEHTTRMVGIVELDRPASDDAALIIGGELLDDPSVGADRLTNNPFMWVAQAPSQDPPVSPNASRNPFLKAKAVQDLVDISRQQNPGGREGRNNRGRGGVDCEAVSNAIGQCLVSVDVNECVFRLGGTSLGPDAEDDFDEGVAILQECGFI
jgi:hypothetical protein